MLPHSKILPAQNLQTACWGQTLFSYNNAAQPAQSPCAQIHTGQTHPLPDLPLQNTQTNICLASLAPALTEARTRMPPKAMWDQAQQTPVDDTERKWSLTATSLAPKGNQILLMAAKTALFPFEESRPH